MRDPILTHLTVTVLHAVHHRWSEGQSHTSAMGSNTVLWVVQKGGLTVRSGLREWQIQAGEAFLAHFPSGRTVFTSSGCEWLSLGISASLFESLDLMPMLPLPALCALDSNQQAAFKFYFEQCNRVLEPESSGPWDSIYFPTAFQLQHLNRTELPALQALALQGAGQALLAQLWVLINPEITLEQIARRNFPDWMPHFMLMRQQQPDISVEEVARELGISRRQLIREFRQWFDMPPRQYLNFLRLEEARRMLLVSDASLKVVANRCGFVSVPHFIRLFNQEFGITPDKYRQGQMINSVV
jgi:AraC-like DNA-binding protein